jgi:hypothetical protein
VTAIVSPICLVALAGAAAAATGLRWRLLIAAVLRSRRPDPRFDRIGGRIKASASTSSARGACCAGRTPASSTRLIFWGFLVLLTAIAQAIVEALWQGFRFNDVPSAFVIAFAQDIFCVAVLAGVALALINRLVVNPARFRASHRGDAVLILAWNHLPRFLLPGTLERHLCAVAATSSSRFPSSRWWRWRAIATSRAQRFLQVHQAQGEVPALDIEAVMNVENEADQHFGLVTLEHFSWKDMLDLYTCTESSPRANPRDARAIPAGGRHGCVGAHLDLAG